jgi:hypothetical protein
MPFFYHPSLKARFALFLTNLIGNQAAWAKIAPIRLAASPVPRGFATLFLFGLARTANKLAPDHKT